MANELEYSIASDQASSKALFCNETAPILGNSAGIVSGPEVMRLNRATVANHAEVT